MRRWDALDTGIRRRPSILLYLFKASLADKKGAFAPLLNNLSRAEVLFNAQPKGAKKAKF